MTKKELEEKLKNIPKDKYIYQRHDGQIHKFLRGEHWLLDTETGLNVPEETMLLGKVSEELIDLIEVGDYVNGYKVEKIKDGYVYVDYCWDCDLYTLVTDDPDNIKTILTKELFEANCYKVKEE